MKVYWQRAYNVRKYDTLRVEVPANWDDMTHQERDEYVCEYAEVYDTEVSDHLDDATRDLAFGSEL